MYNDCSVETHQQNISYISKNNKNKDDGEQLNVNNINLVSEATIETVDHLYTSTSDLDEHKTENDVDFMSTILLNIEVKMLFRNILK